MGFDSSATCRGCARRQLRRALTNGDGRRRLLVCLASIPTRSVTEHLHKCPFSTMAVLSLGMGADQVRFLSGAQAVTTARCLRVAPVVTAVNADKLKVSRLPSKQLLPSSILGVRSSRAPKLENATSVASRANRARRYASKAARCGGNLPSFHRWVRFPLLARGHGLGVATKRADQNSFFGAASLQREGQSVHGP